MHKRNYSATSEAPCCCLDVPIIWIYLFFRRIFTGEIFCHFFADFWMTNIWLWIRLSVLADNLVTSYIYVCIEIIQYMCMLVSCWHHKELIQMQQHILLQKLTETKEMTRFSMHVILLFCIQKSTRSYNFNTIYHSGLQGDQLLLL